MADDLKRTFLFRFTSLHGEPREASVDFTPMLDVSKLPVVKAMARKAVNASVSERELEPAFWRIDSVHEVFDQGVGPALRWPVPATRDDFFEGTSPADLPFTHYWPN